MCQADLGRKLLRTKGNVSLVVDNLASRGLVERRRSSDDRRRMTVVLTAAGRELISGYFPAHARAITAAMSVLSADEQEQLGTLARRLGLSQQEGPA
jgi:MarR family 2-MHQ and catechol resistance regulon transcriptional repressor